MGFRREKWRVRGAPFFDVVALLEQIGDAGDEYPKKVSGFLDIRTPTKRFVLRFSGSGRRTLRKTTPAGEIINVLEQEFNERLAGNKKTIDELWDKIDKLEGRT